MPEHKMKETVIDLSQYYSSQQRELEAYRRLGTVQELRRMRRLEIRRKNRIKVAKKLLKLLFFGAALLFDIWVFASWIDIILHNLNPDPIYQAWNFFTLFF